MRNDVVGREEMGGHLDYLICAGWFPLETGTEGKKLEAPTTGIQS